MKSVFTLIVILSVSISAFADFTANMVARWTFNDNSSEAAALTDDVAGLKMAKKITGADGSFKINPDGTLYLGSAINLVCDAINSKDEKFAALRNNMTIYCRIKFPEEIKSGPSFAFGLQNDLRSADWKQLVAATLYQPAGWGLRVMVQGDKETGMSSGHLAWKKDDFSDVALIFNGTTKRIILYVDGKTTERHALGTKIADFQSLMVGRLKTSSGSPMIIDEVRVYSSPLSAEWIAEIEPVAK